MPTKVAPPPLEVDTARIAVAGTILWAVALVVVLLLGDRLDPVWAWTCLAGILIGFAGLGIMRWQDRSRRRP